MTKQKRRRSVHVVGAWDVEFEDLSTPERPLYRHTYRDRDPDPRLMKATGNPARTMKYVRCSSDGRIVGALMETSEGLRGSPTSLRDKSYAFTPRSWMSFQRRSLRNAGFMESGRLPPMR